ncbi:MAG: DNA recombination protein RmuC [Devosiaceae bacterium]|nr:DNA recombination protein RmuC [Devosiaceae bacterium]
MENIVFYINGQPINIELIVLVFIGFIALLLIIMLIILLNASKRRKSDSLILTQRSNEFERHLASLLQVQSEMTGRMQTMSEIFGTRTSDLSRTLSERIDNANQRVGHQLTENREKTEQSLSKLSERLAVIDKAQTNITELSSEIVSLQSILSNKQTRGAYGQGRMETIIGDGLAQNAYSFQATLSNNTRPDCLVYMPNDAPALVIDAKFPLEAWQRINSANGAQELKLAKAAFRNDVGVHIKDISSKYLIAGETQDTAFMFVPSESIFADLHEHFEDMVQKAARARVVIVSPSLLMLSIQVVHALLRDVRMREQAHLIQREVHLLMEDISRLDERVNKLQTHFAQSTKDIEMIATSSSKISKRSSNIEAMEFSEQNTKNIEEETT